MSSSRVSRTLSIAALTGLLGSQCLAAVTILEGSDPAVSAPSAPAAPSLSPALESPATSQPAPPPADAPQAVTPQQVPSETTPLLPAAPPLLAAPPPAPNPPQASFDTSDLPKSPPPNPAQLSVEMLPGQTLTVGSYVSFKVTSKKPGYVVLMDVDATGHLTQIYPNTASLVRASRANGNYVKPGSSMVIPLATDPYAGVRYVVSPPNGQAMIVGILSAAPVQILDLPDIPVEILGKPEMVLAYLTKRTSELRIPNEGDQIREGKWSFDARPYTIQ